MDDDDMVRLRRAVLRTARMLNATATEGGLTPTQASVLGLVVVRGPLRLTELADLERLNPTMLSRVVGKLTDAGLVTRVADSGDRRSATVTSTAHGRREYGRIRSRRATVVGAAAQRLSSADRTALTRALSALEHLADELA